MPIRKEQRKHFRMGNEAEAQTSWVNRDFADETDEERRKQKEKEKQRQKAKKKAEDKKKQLERDRRKKEAEFSRRASRLAAEKLAKERQARLRGKPARIELSLVREIADSVSPLTRRFLITATRKANLAASERQKLGKALYNEGPAEQGTAKGFDIVLDALQSDAKAEVAAAIRASDACSGSSRATLLRVLGE